MESKLRKRHIKWITNARVKNVATHTMHVEELDDSGALRNAHELPFAFAMMLPAFRGVPALRGVEKLTNPRGFVLVDKHQRNPTFPDVFAVGVCVAIPPVEATPVPVGVPKTGSMIESMVTATAHNIGALLRGQPAREQATWNAICLADFGDRGVVFVASHRSRHVTSTGRHAGRGCIWLRSGSRNTSCVKCETARASRSTRSSCSSSLISRS